MKRIFLIFLFVVPAYGDSFLSLVKRIFDTSYATFPYSYFGRETVWTGKMPAGGVSDNKTPIEFVLYVDSEGKAYVTILKNWSKTPEQAIQKAKAYVAASQGKIYPLRADNDSNHSFVAENDRFSLPNLEGAPTVVPAMKRYFRRTYNEGVELTPMLVDKIVCVDRDGCFGYSFHETINYEIFSKPKTAAGGVAPVIIIDPISTIYYPEEPPGPILPIVPNYHKPHPQN